MATTPLPNYLRAHRRRLALSQDEMAFLLGIRDGSQVCRNERFVHVPTLETALAYEAIFQRPAKELFGGLYQKVERDVEERAKALAYRTDLRDSDRLRTRKRLTLSGISRSKPSSQLS